MKTKTKLYDYFYSMTKEKQEDFASRAGTQRLYLYNHLIPKIKDRPDRQPKIDTMKSIAKATNGRVSYENVVKHFYIHGV